MDVKVFASLNYLGMEIIQEPGKLQKLFEKFNLQDSRAVATPAESYQSLNKKANEIKFPYREAVGSLMYLSIATRPDITYAVSHASRFLDSYDEDDVNAVKRIFKYLRGSVYEGITFQKTKNLNIDCYTDSGA